MSRLRPECGTYRGSQAAMSYDTAVWLIRRAVARRRSLIYGRLHDGAGHHCAIGAFWEDNPHVVLNSSLVDEVAAVNDSVPPSATAHERWKAVNSWLRFKLKAMTASKS